MNDDQIIIYRQRKLYFQIFLPVLLLAFFQLGSYWFYAGYALDIRISTQLLVSACYILTLITIILFVSSSSGKVALKKERQTNLQMYFSVFLLAFSALVLLKPALALLKASAIYGYGAVRSMYFRDPAFRGEIAGSGKFLALITLYLVPSLWFYLYLNLNKVGRIANLTFWGILCVLVLYNAAYSGRFAMYFALYLLILRSFYHGYNVAGVLKKNSVLVLSLLVASFLIVGLRTNLDNSTDTLIDFRNWWRLFEYHNIGPFFLSQKIDENLFDVGYPFQVTIENLFVPLLSLFGMKSSETVYKVYRQAFDNFTLVSEKSDSVYNAFSTFYAYFFYETSWLAPVFAFMFVGCVFLLSFLIKSYSARTKYLMYFSFCLYFSFFQSYSLNVGVIMFLLFYPTYDITIRKLKKYF